MVRKSLQEQEITFAGWLKADRIRRGMSQTEYGTFLEGTSHATIGKYENPEHEPEKDFLKIVSRCCKADIGFLSSIAYKDATHNIPPEVMALAAEIKLLPEDRQKLIRAAIGWLAFEESK